MSFFRRLNQDRMPLRGECQVISPPAAKGHVLWNPTMRLWRGNARAEGADGILKAFGLEPSETKSSDKSAEGGSPPALQLNMLEDMTA
ncbi:hypothetical protein OAN24_01550 [Pseudodesulfovibrio sp.]|nr:hypothetical protein [Pseudodesulfovibrio sp.]